MVITRKHLILKNLLTYTNLEVGWRPDSEWGDFKVISDLNSNFNGHMAAQCAWYYKHQGYTWLIPVFVRCLPK